MIENYNQIKNLSVKYNVPEYDVLLIALNILGISDHYSDSPRLRMKLRLLDSDKNFYFGLPNNSRSVFTLKDKNIYFDSLEFAKVENTENDDCASSYFRKNNTVLTVNTNKRSVCSGCKFCPNNLELNSADDILTKENHLYNHLINKVNSVGYSDFEKIERVTICTGCFGKEKFIVEHILSVYKVLKKLNFNGTLHYIGSEIQTESALKIIKDNVDDFMYTMSIECFERRSYMLKSVKASMTLEDYEKLGYLCIKNGFTVNYIYIVGLDSLDTMFKEFRRLKKVTNYFPSLNVFQAHTDEHYELRCKEAEKLEYYLKVRVFIEDLYKESSLKPKSWECYRPLWFFKYNNQDNKGITI